MIKRRDVIKCGAAVAAGLVGAPAAKAEKKLSEDWSIEPWIALLSDPHIDADADMVVREANMATQLSAVVEKLLQAEPQPEHVIINGDCARDTGEAGDYAVFNRILTPLENAPPHLWLTLGNHDHRQRFIDGMGRNSKNYLAFGRHQHTFTAHADSLWILMDSLRETDEIAGELGHEQRRWLTSVLDRYADDSEQKIFIMVHHQPEDPMDPDDDGFGLADGQALIDLLWDRKQVKAVFHGHRHEWGVREVNGLHLVGLPSTAYVFKEGEPAGYVEAKVRPDHLELTRRCLDPADAAEGQIHRLVYR